MGLAAQHVLTMFGSTVAVPLIFGPRLWPVPEGLSEQLRATLTVDQLTNTALLISSVMLCSGVATFLQATFGSRLPIIQGVSFSFLAAFFGIVATTQTMAAPDWSAVVAGDSSEGVNPMATGWKDKAAPAAATNATPGHIGRTGSGVRCC